MLICRWINKGLVQCWDSQQTHQYSQGKMKTNTSQHALDWNLAVWHPCGVLIQYGSWHPPPGENLSVKKMTLELLRRTNLVTSSFHWLLACHSSPVLPWCHSLLELLFFHLFVTVLRMKEVRSNLPLLTQCLTHCPSWDFPLLIYTSIICSMEKKDWDLKKKKSIFQPLDSCKTAIWWLLCISHVCSWGAHLVRGQYSASSHHVIRLAMYWTKGLITVPKYFQLTWKLLLAWHWGCNIALSAGLASSIFFSPLHVNASSFFLLLIAHEIWTPSQQSRGFMKHKRTPGFYHAMPL